MLSADLAERRTKAGQPFLLLGDDRRRSALDEACIAELAFGFANLAFKTRDLLSEPATLGSGIDFDVQQQLLIVDDLDWSGSAVDRSGDIGNDIDL